jgi:hypothetical protein
VRVRDLPGIRVAARPDALDRAIWHGDGTSPGAPVEFRFAPDEAFAAVGIDGTVDVDDEHAIVVPEPGFVAVECTAEEFVRVIVPHVEWTVPPGPAFVQGAIANVPARVRITEDGAAVVLVAKAHEHEFRARIGSSG